MSNKIKVHHLKCVPEVFREKLAKNKPWEYRRYDRGFSKDDMIVEREWSEKGGYTGREVWETISLIVVGGQFQIPSGFVIMTCIYWECCENFELSTRNPQSYDLDPPMTGDNLTSKELCYYEAFRDLEEDERRKAVGKAVEFQKANPGDPIPFAAIRVGAKTKK